MLTILGYIFNHLCIVFCDLYIALITYTKHVFRQLMFLDANGDRMFMTTETNIIPDTQPAEPCYDSETCYSIMV